MRQDAPMVKKGRRDYVVGGVWGLRLVSCGFVYTEECGGEEGGDNLYTRMARNNVLCD